jgi:putative RNA 2'-phosphotransferase
VNDVAELHSKAVQSVQKNRSEAGQHPKQIMDKELVRLSKFLSLVLRHRPEEIGIHLDEGGWASVDKLLQVARHSGVPLDVESLRKVVEQNDKQRFTISEDGHKIRANQGHSISIAFGP